MVCMCQCVATYQCARMHVSHAYSCVSMCALILKCMRQYQLLHACNSLGYM